MFLVPPGNDDSGRSTAGALIRRTNVLNQQSRMGWDCLDTADNGDLGATPPPLGSAPVLGEEESSLADRNDVEKMRKVCASEDTIEARSMVCSVYGPRPLFAGIKRLRICQSPDRWIPGVQSDWGQT